jgi:triosephosphate isomerase
MKIIAANWKMHHAFDEADDWLNAFLKGFALNEAIFQDREIILCPPSFLLDYIDSELMNEGFEHLESIMQREQRKIEDFSSEELTEIVLNERRLKLGAQDCHHEENGSFTGNISASMIKKVGCDYVIIGHSERRGGHFEKNEIIAKKIKRAAEQHIAPILCIGESKDVRDQGKHLEFVYKQLMNSIPQDVHLPKLIIAYEPIWSIGTGVTPTVEQIGEIAKLLKKITTDKLNGVADEFFILYGGSVTSQNSAAIMAIPNIDGLLVGKASLDPNEFLKISIS